VDEAHCLRKATAERIAKTKAVVLGLTATPFTKGLGNVYDSLVNVTTTNKLIEDGYLCPLKMYAAKAVDMTGAKVVAGEWAESEIEKRGTEILGDIVSEWVDKTRLNFGGPVKTIVFSATVDHGAEICKRFQEAGYNFQQVSYRDGSDQTRRELIEEFRKPDSSIHGLVSCEVFTKGFDVPDLLCGISARPYRKSLSSHIQQLGRVMRRAEGKKFGIWLDHSGNVLRFYKDTQEIFENGMQALDDGEHDAKARKEPEAKEKAEIACSCGYILAPFHKVCPSCGKEIRRRSLIETLPGEMVELNGLKASKLPEWMRDREGIWFELCTWAAGKKSGDLEAARKLALAKYRAWYGEWPPPEAGFQPICEPSLDLHRRIKHDTIKWAKGQQAAKRMAHA
jgi:superfamily II DNA or RNA helicase